MEKMDNEDVVFERIIDLFEIVNPQEIKSDNPLDVSSPLYSEDKETIPLIKVPNFLEEEYEVLKEKYYEVVESVRYIEDFFNEKNVSLLSSHRNLKVRKKTVEIRKLLKDLRFLLIHFDKLYKVANKGKRGRKKSIELWNKKWYYEIMNFGDQSMMKALNYLIGENMNYFLC